MLRFTGTICLDGNIYEPNEMLTANQANLKLAKVKIDRQRWIKLNKVLPCFQDSCNFLCVFAK